MFTKGIPVLQVGELKNARMELSAMLIEFDMYVDGNNVKMKLDDELVVRLKENLSYQHDEISSKTLKEDSDFVGFGDSLIERLNRLYTYFAQASE